MVTVMMLAHNDREIIEEAVDSFRLFGDTDLSFIIVDNGSTDGLREWASGQTDLTYVFLEEGPIGWGRAINMVRRELHIDTDLLVMEGHYLLTPQCLPRMVASLHEEGTARGGVGGVFSEETSYKKAVETAGKVNHMEGKRVMMLRHSAVLWRKEALEEIGEFDESMETLSMVVGDYCLRMIKADQELFICPNAFFWQGKRSAIVAEKQWEREMLENKWGMHYFNVDYNRKLISLLDEELKEEAAVLEIGCDCGATLLEIKNRHPGAKVYGTEINAQSASIAAHFAQVAVNNIEDKNLPFDKNMFDCIIFGDVLEHLHNPSETLGYCREFLREGGCIVASIPNVMHISIMEQLLRGDFTYTETGLLDKTHIHLFTCNEIIRTFDEAGYEISSMGFYDQPINDRQKRIIDSLLAIDHTAQRFMYETVQYLVRAKRK